MFLALTRKLVRIFFSSPPGAGSLPSGALAPAQARAIKLIERFPPIHKLPLSIGRPTYVWVDRLFSQDSATMRKVRQHCVTTRDQHTLAVREYEPLTRSGKDADPILMYFHGGGCVIGNLESHDNFCRYIADRTGYRVFAVDYRLGPESPYPKAVDDAICAWNWLHQNAENLAIDSALIGVGGDSAGAYLATLIAQQANAPSRPEPVTKPPAYQWLIYPMLDLRGQSDAYASSTSGMLLTRDLMNFFRNHYLNHPDERSHPLASPLLADLAAPLAPAYILTVGHDPLMQDGLSYRHKLQEAGSEVIHDHFDHIMHGFISFGGICPYALEAMDRAIDQLQQLSLAITIPANAGAGMSS